MFVKRMRPAGMALAVLGVLVFASAPARAEDQGTADAELLDAVRALQAEVAALKTDVAAVRADQKRILAELAAIKRASRSPQRQKKKPDTTVYDVKVEGSPVLGPKDAPVTIVEFADLQCPFCIREYPVLQQVLKDYPNDVRVVFKHFPLSFHKQAKPAHAATALAAKKGDEMFWKMHDLIVKNPRKLSVPNLRKHAESLGLDLDEFDAVMDDPKQINALLAADMAEARKCKVSGTPTIFINGLKLASRNPAGYKARIDEILKEKKKTDTQ